MAGKDWWDPKGSARRKEAFSYLQAINSGMSEEKMAETVESTAPNKEFGKAFMSQFFKPSDLPFLLKFMK